MNATPMMDVMLVLLVVFMVVTPLIHGGPDLVLPVARQAEPLPPQVLTIRLSLAGELSTDGGVISNSDLAGVLRGRSDIRLMVEADRRLPYGEVEQLLADAGVAGLLEVGLIALRKHPDRR